MTLTLAAGGPSAYWYLTRSTGAVALVLLTIAIALGSEWARRSGTPASLLPHAHPTTHSHRSSR